MENYKKTLRQRLSLNYIMVFIAVMAVVLINRGIIPGFPKEDTFGDFFSGFQLGLFIIYEIALIASSAKVYKVLKDDKKLKECYIEETDERNVKISELTGIKLYNSIFYPIALSALIAGYFSAEVFFTLVSVMFFISAVVLCRKIHFQKTI